jgi:hypothetical protein
MSGACCHPQLPFLVLGHAFMDETYSLCVKLRNGSTVNQSPQCAGCSTFVTADTCMLECARRANCAFYQFEPVVEYYHVAHEGAYQCAYNCEAQGLERRVCACGKCSLFNDTNTSAQLTPFANLKCSAHGGPGHKSSCGAHSPASCQQRRDDVDYNTATTTTRVTHSKTSPTEHQVQTSAAAVTTTKPQPARPYAGVYIAFGLLLSALFGLGLFVLLTRNRRRRDVAEEIPLPDFNPPPLYEEPVAYDVARQEQLCEDLQAGAEA